MTDKDTEKEKREKKREKTMEFSFEKSAFDRAVTPALGCVSGKNTLASIEGILLTAEKDAPACRLCSYDLEKGYQSSFEANVTEGGSYIINAQKLSSIVRALPDGEIHISIDEKNLVKIYNGKSVFELVALSGSAFPSMPVLSGERKFTIRRGTLRSVIDQVSYAIAQNDSRPSLNGAFFRITGDKMLAVSCDGNRMALREQTCELSDVDAGNDVAEDGTVTRNETGILNCEFIVPGKTLAELNKLMGGDEEEPIRIQLSRKHAVFEIGDGEVLFSRIIDSDYIDFERFIPKSNKTFVTIDRERFLHGMEMASLFSEDRTPGQPRTGVTCIFDDGGLTIASAAASGRFVDEIPAEVNGPKIELCFNCRFLLDALRSCTAPRLLLSMSTPMMSMLIEAPESDRSDSERFLMLVLPMKPLK